MKRIELKQFEIWIKGIVAAAISGGAGGVLTGLAAVGIDPAAFQFANGNGSDVTYWRGGSLDQCGNRRRRIFAEVTAAY